MARIRLTDKAVASARVAEGERLELFDQDVRGLILRVSSGRKTWVFRYRNADGVQRRHTLGIYLDGFTGGGGNAPDEAKHKALTLSQARAAARTLINQVGENQDPSADRELKISAAKAEPIKTLNDLRDIYFKACEIGEYRPRGKKKRASTLAEEQGVYRRHIEGPLGAQRLENVTPSAIKDVLRDLLLKGHGTTSNRVRSLLRQLFNFAIHEERLEVNPINRVKAMAEEKPRERVLSDDELRVIWKVLNDPEGYYLPATDGQRPEKLKISEPVRIAIKLLMLKLVRRAEVALMHTSELDLAQASWVIPGARTKNAKAHFVPLAPEAVELIERAIEVAKLGDDASAPKPKARYAFPSPRGKGNPITPGAITRALRNIKLALGIKDIRPHDLRRTAATIMASERLGISPFMIGRLLNHTTETGGAAVVTGRVYMLHEFAAEKRAALNAWAKLLYEIVGEREQASNVVMMNRN